MVFVSTCMRRISHESRNAFRPHCPLSWPARERDDHIKNDSRFFFFWFPWSIILLHVMLSNVLPLPLLVGVRVFLPLYAEACFLCKCCHSARSSDENAFWVGKKDTSEEIEEEGRKGVERVSVPPKLVFPRKSINGPNKEEKRRCFPRFGFPCSICCLTVREILCQHVMIRGTTSLLKVTHIETSWQTKVASVPEKHEVLLGPQNRITTHFSLRPPRAVWTFKCVVATFFEDCVDGCAGFVYNLSYKTEKHTRGLETIPPVRPGILSAGYNSGLWW